MSNLVDLKDEGYQVDVVEKNIFLTDRGFVFDYDTLGNVHNLYEQLQMTNKIMSKNDSLSSTEAWNLAGEVKANMNEAIDNFIKKTDLENTIINEVIEDYLDKSEIDLD